MASRKFFMFFFCFNFFFGIGWQCYEKGAFIITWNLVIAGLIGAAGGTLVGYGVQLLSQKIKK